MWMGRRQNARSGAASEDFSKAETRRESRTEAKQGDGESKVWEKKECLPVKDGWRSRKRMEYPKGTAESTRKGMEIKARGCTESRTKRKAKEEILFFLGLVEYRTIYKVEEKWR